MPGRVAIPALVLFSRERQAAASVAMASSDPGPGRLGLGVSGRAAAAARSAPGSGRCGLGAPGGYAGGDLEGAPVVAIVPLALAPVSPSRGGGSSVPGKGGNGNSMGSLTGVPSTQGSYGS